MRLFSRHLASFLSRPFARPFSRSRRAPRIGGCARLLLSTAVVWSGGPAQAEEWELYGARYQALGGAGVAAAEGLHAAYWNPGALAFASPIVEVEIPASISLRATGDLLEDAAGVLDFVEERNFRDTITRLQRGRRLSPEQIQATIDLFVNQVPPVVRSEEGVLGTASVGAVLRARSLVVSHRTYAAVGVDPRLDLRSLSLEGDLDLGRSIGRGMDRSAEFTNAGSQSLADLIVSRAGLRQNQAEELVFQAERLGLDTSSEALRSLIRNFSSAATVGARERAASAGDGVSIGLGNGAENGIEVRGLLVKELALAYGVPVIPDRLGLGVNLKFMHGTTLHGFAPLDAIDEIGEQISRTHSRVRTKRMGVDIGLLARPRDWLRVGVTARNVNNPSFRSRGHEPIELSAQVRAGVAAEVNDRWLVSADFDLTANDSEVLDGLDTRMLALGVEYRGAFLGRTTFIRGGAHTNVARGADHDVTLSLGFGFLVDDFRFDLSVSSGSRREDVESLGASLPRRLEFSGGLRWIIAEF